MFKTVTAYEAISRGDKIISTPISIIFIICIGLPAILFHVAELSPWYILLGFVLGSITSWIYWSYAIVKWRVWAFTNVNDIHRLKELAKKHKFIGVGDWMSAKTEIWDTEQREHWEQIEKRLSTTEASFIDNLKIPNETILVESKRTSMIISTSLLLFLLIGLFSAILNKHYFVAVGLFTTAAIIAFFMYRNYIKKKYIILNEEGISTDKIQFYSWGQIRHEEVNHLGEGDYNFTYKHPEGWEEISIVDYIESHEQLEELLYIYRKRYERKMIGDKI